MNLCSTLLQYHVSKVSQSEPPLLTSSAAMDDLESALQSLEVKMEGEKSSASDMLVSASALLTSIKSLLHFNASSTEIKSHVL